MCHIKPLKEYEFLTKSCTAQINFSVNEFCVYQIIASCFVHAIPVFLFVDSKVFLLLYLGLGLIGFIKVLFFALTSIFSHYSFCSDSYRGSYGLQNTGSIHKPWRPWSQVIMISSTWSNSCWICEFSDGVLSNNFEKFCFVFKTSFWFFV